MKFLKTFIIILVIGATGIILFSFYIKSLFKESFSFFSKVPQQEISPSPKKEYQIENIRFFLSEGWVKAEKEEIENLFSLGKEEKKYNPKLLFLAYKIKEKDIIQFFIEKGELKENSSLEKIIDIIKETNKKREWNLEIISEKTDPENKILEFEAICEKEGHFPLFIKERIMLFEKEGEEFYLIGFVTLKEKKEKFLEEIEEILNSIQIIY